MIKGKLAALLILLLSFCLLANLFCIYDVCADSLDEYMKRVQQWHQTEWKTGAFGSTEMIGRYGPDWGAGETGYVYEYKNPASGAYISYRFEGMGMGMGGMWAGYGGKYSPNTQAAYGPYWGGGSPNIQWMPGYDTQGYLEGSTWGPNINYYSARVNPMYSLMSGLFNIFGGGGWYGSGAGYPNYGYWGASPQGYSTRIY